MRRRVSVLQKGTALVLLAVGASQIYLGRALAQGLINTGESLGKNIENIYRQSVPIVLLLAFLAVIYAGYIYITSLGNSEKITEAKNWLVAAILGAGFMLLIPLILKAIGAGE